MILLLAIVILFYSGEHCYKPSSQYYVHILLIGFSYPSAAFTVLSVLLRCELALCLFFLYQVLKSDVITLPIF